MESHTTRQVERAASDTLRWGRRLDRRSLVSARKLSRRIRGGLRLRDALQLREMRHPDFIGVTVFEIANDETVKSVGTLEGMQLIDLPALCRDIQHALEMLDEARLPSARSDDAVAGPTFRPRVKFATET